jgi:hypothetical protein
MKLVGKGLADFSAPDAAPGLTGLSGHDIPGHFDKSAII